MTPTTAATTRDRDPGGARGCARTPSPGRPVATKLGASTVRVRRGQWVTVTRKACHRAVVPAKAGLAGSLESRTKTPSPCGEPSPRAMPGSSTPASGVAVRARRPQGPRNEPLDKVMCQWFACGPCGGRGHRGPCQSGRRTRSGARAPAGRARGATFGGDARRTRRADPPEGQLPPADAGVARAGPRRRAAPLGWADRAAAGRQRGVLRRVAGRARRGSLGRPGAHRRPAVRALSHRRGREDRS